MAVCVRNRNHRLLDALPFIGPNAANCRRGILPRTNRAEMRKSYVIHIEIGNDGIVYCESNLPEK